MAERLQEKETGRLEAFSDGVLAIAITLLILNLQAQYRGGPVSYLTAFILAFVSAWASVGVCLALALFFSFQGFAQKGSA